MAYGLRYTVTWSSEDETTEFLLEMYQDGYTYAEEPALTPAEEPCILAYDTEEGPDDPNWSIALSTLEVQVLDAAGRLSALAGIEEKEVKGLLYANDVLIFEGFAVPGQYIYDRHLSSVASISFVRGESFMRTRLYRTLAGANFTGLVSPLEVIRNCFQLAGNSGYILTGMYWLPRLTNNLDAAHDPLRRLRVLQDEFVDEEGNPITCWDVLQIMLRQYQLQLFNDAASWFVAQRRRVVDTVNNEFEAFIHTNLSTQTTIDLPYALDIWNDDRTTLQGYSISHTRPFKYAGAIYNHLGPEVGVLRFGGFEQTGFTDADILKTALSPPGTTDVWIVSADMAGIEISPPGADYTIQSGPRAGARTSSAKSLSIPAEYAAAAYDYTDDADNGDMEDLRDEFATHPYAFQETSGFIQGGTDVSLIFRANVAMNWKSSVAQTTEVFFCMRIKVGDYWVVPSGLDDGIFVFTETPTNNDHYIVFRVESIGFDWASVLVQTDVLDDSGTPITGPLYIELLAGVEAQNAIGQLSTKSRWDDVTFEVIDADGNPENQATQAVAVYSASQNTYGPEAAVLLFGDGPTTGHKRRQQIQDGAGSVVDVPGDWQFGRTFTGDDSGESHLSFWVKERLKQNQHPLLRADFELQLHDTLVDALPPTAVFRDQRRLKLAANVSMGASSITVIPDPAIDPKLYGVIQCKRDIVIDGAETHRVLHAVLTTEATNTWTLYLDDTLAAGYTTGDSVVQTIDLTWTSWRYSCRKNRARITAIELLAGDEPDVTCSYDVKPGSLQATSLTDLVGIPCAEDITPPFIPPSAEAGTLFFSSYDSSNSLVEEYSMLRKDPDGTITVLKSFTGTPELTHAHDPVNKWLVVVDGLDIWRMRFDGSDQALIYTLVGYDRIGDIDHVAAGTYAGQFVFVAYNTGGTDDDVYRIDIDGNATKISSNTYASSQGIVVKNGTTVLCNTNFSAAGIVSYGLAGTIYSIENTTQLFNSGRGITYDPDQDQVYTERGISTSALARSPAGISGSYTDFTGFATSSRLDPVWFDRANQRIYYGGTGINYRAIGALNTAVAVAPLVGGSGATGNYGTTKITVVQ